ncbi:hypothetical protein SRHO_G00237980 [Serrasalmus rhombeus]
MRPVHWRRSTTQNFIYTPKKEVLQALEATSQTHLTSESTLSSERPVSAPPPPPPPPAPARTHSLTRRSCHRTRTEDTRAEPHSAPVHRGRDL